MHVVLALIDHWQDDSRPDPRIVGALVAILIVCTVINWSFWSDAYSALMEVVRWTLSDSPVEIRLR